MPCNLPNAEADGRFNVGAGGPRSYLNGIHPQLISGARHPTRLIVKQRLVSSINELDSLEATIASAAHATAERLARELSGSDALGAMARLKFAPTGCDPLDLERSLNFVEQLNQSFTYLASIEATRWLFRQHPDHAPFILSLGTSPGSDIASADGAVVAEVFAATHPDSNNKMRKDIQKVRATTATHRYVFYLSPVPSTMRDDDVTIIWLSHVSLSGHTVPGA